MFPRAVNVVYRYSLVIFTNIAFRDAADYAADDVDVFELVGFAFIIFSIVFAIKHTVVGGEYDVIDYILVLCLFFVCVVVFVRYKYLLSVL